jgi:hypothetical protein
LGPKVPRNCILIVFASRDSQTDAVVRCFSVHPSGTTHQFSIPHCYSHSLVLAQVEVSIFRVGLGRKFFLLFRAEKILPMTIPLDASGLNFWVGLGRATCAFYSVKQLKTTFRAGLGPKKKFAGFKISAHARPVRFVGGPGVGRARAGPAGRAEPGSECSGIAPGIPETLCSIIPSTPRPMPGLWRRKMKENRLQPQL